MNEFIILTSCSNEKCGWFGLSDECISYDAGDGTVYSCPMCKKPVALRTVSNPLLKSLKPDHKCEPIAKAIKMDKDRIWWVGRLTEPVPEWPGEKFCLHMKTPVKDVAFLCNTADFQWLSVLSCATIGKLDEVWLDRVTEQAKKNC